MLYVQWSPWYRPRAQYARCCHPACEESERITSRSWRCSTYNGHPGTAPEGGSTPGVAARTPRIYTQLPFCCEGVEVQRQIDMGRSDRWMDRRRHDGARMEVTELAEHVVDFSAHLGETGQCRPPPSCSKAQQQALKVILTNLGNAGLLMTARPRECSKIVWNPPRSRARWAVERNCRPSDSALLVADGELGAA